MCHSYWEVRWRPEKGNGGNVSNLVSLVLPGISFLMKRRSIWWRWFKNINNELQIIKTLIFQLFWNPVMNWWPKKYTHETRKTLSANCPRITNLLCGYRMFLKQPKETASTYNFTVARLHHMSFLGSSRQIFRNSFIIEHLWLEDCSS